MKNNLQANHSMNNQLVKLETLDLIRKLGECRSLGVSNSFPFEGSYMLQLEKANAEVEKECPFKKSRQRQFF